jgi:hypothetical protein
MKLAFLPAVVIPAVASVPAVVGLPAAAVVIRAVAVVIPAVAGVPYEVGLPTCCCHPCCY